MNTKTNRKPARPMKTTTTWALVGISRITMSHEGDFPLSVFKTRKSASLCAYSGERVACVEIREITKGRAK